MKEKKQEEREKKPKWEEQEGARRKIVGGTRLRVTHCHIIRTRRKKTLPWESDQGGVHRIRVLQEINLTAPFKCRKNGTTGLG